MKQTSPPNTFVNPFLGCDKHGPTVKVGARLPEPVYNAIRTLRLQEGTVQTTICLLWQKLVKECHARDITSFVDKDRFEHFVANARLILPEELGDGCSAPKCDSIIESDSGGPTSLPDGETNPPSVGGGTASQGGGVANTQDGGANAKGNPGVRSKSRGSKGKN